MLTHILFIEIIDPIKLALNNKHILNAKSFYNFLESPVFNVIDGHFKYIFPHKSYGYLNIGKASNLNHD